MWIAENARLKFIIGIALSVLVLVSYWGVLENDFIYYDDPLYVTANRWVAQGLDRETAVWAFTDTQQAKNWHPLTWLSILLDRELFGLKPAGYHWTNVLFHLLAGLFLFAFLNRSTGMPWRSGMVAALFLVHPLHVESVAWIAERKDVLSALCWMSGLWSYVRYANHPSLVRYLWVVLTFVLGLLSKPMMVTFPFVLLLLDFWPLRRAEARQLTWFHLVGEKFLLFLLSLTSSVITLIVQQDAMPTLSIVPFSDRLANAAVSYVAYMGKTFWPSGLSVFYPYQFSPPLWQLIAILALLVTITVFTLLRTRRLPYLAMGWLWYLGTLIPVIGLVQVGAQAMADRYTYLPLVGIFIMAVWGMGDILDQLSKWRVIGVVIAVSVLGALMILTVSQIGYWRDTSTLFTRALQCTERNYIAYHILAEEMKKAGDQATAEKYYREAIRIRPSFKAPYTGLGHLLFTQGRKEEAGSLLEKALRIDTAYVPALKNLADVKMSQGQIGEALRLYRKAFEEVQDNPELLNNFGIALFLTEHWEEAVSRFQEAVRLQPGYKEARNNLKKVLEVRKPSG
ncbi:MAG: tetratricopeptide repeat protein [Deltaproteobacteria bacterium]|nr:tetratricopeptide repeat protein [Deltaproteobacteria bacterium]